MSLFCAVLGWTIAISHYRYVLWPTPLICYNETPCTAEALLALLAVELELSEAGRAGAAQIP
jgi:hypothetical protein